VDCRLLGGAPGIATSAPSRPPQTHGRARSLRTHSADPRQMGAPGHSACQYRSATGRRSRNRPWRCTAPAVRTIPPGSGAAPHDVHGQATPRVLGVCSTVARSDRLASGRAGRHGGIAGVGCGVTNTAESWLEGDHGSHDQAVAVGVRNATTNRHRARGRACGRRDRTRASSSTQCVYACRE